MKTKIKKWTNPRNGELRLYINDSTTSAKVYIINQPELGSDYSVKYYAEDYWDFSIVDREGCSSFYDMAINCVTRVANELGLEGDKFKYTDLLAISE
jgi:hypothetical protein